ncbi:MAG: tRNA adenosine(34) deaminase TadA [Candidatus Omnitrophica bacterium]|nr:tRNA adenosine(34) deaminase TadA [Candidatus Omnitrophota bacterium]
MAKDEDIYFMKEAIKEAGYAFQEDEVPVGCVIVKDKRIIARGHNQVELLQDSTAHAEMIALTAACEALKSKWLNDCTLYVTIEPCSMCAGAMVLARIKRLVFGCFDPKTGACGSVVNIIHNKKLNHRILITSGILKEDCKIILQEFFKGKRKK